MVLSSTASRGDFRCDRAISGEFQSMREKRSGCSELNEVYVSLHPPSEFVFGPTTKPNTHYSMHTSYFADIPHFGLTTTLEKLHGPCNV